MQIRSVVVVAALGCSAIAYGQQAVQWRVEDGGNGHWYQVKQASSAIAWSSARGLAEGLGGHLASLASQSENLWVYNTLASSPEFWNGPQGPYLGGFRNPSSGWQWVTGEPWSFAAWGSGSPSGGTEACLHFGNGNVCWCPDPNWNDIDDLNPSWPIRAFVVEWSADCNGDGIVDFGQIASGQFSDADGDYIPDCCEGGSPEDCWSAGGGKHLVRNGGFDVGSAWWSYSNIDGSGGWRESGGLPGGRFILNDGGAGSTDPTIEQLVTTLEPGAAYRLTGDFRGESIASSPVGGVSFAVDIDGIAMFTAQAVDLTTWRQFAIDFTPSASSVMIRLRAETNGTDNDFAIDNITLVLIAAPCAGDVTGNGLVDGLDLAAVLGAWGTGGKGEFPTDRNDDGVVDAQDLALVLSGWGPCP
jgi:hypothetical protein